MENEENITSIRGSWAETFKIWKELAINEDEMIQTILENVEVL